MFSQLASLGISFPGDKGWCEGVSVSFLHPFPPAPTKGKGQTRGLAWRGGGYTKAEVQMVGGGALFAWTARGRQSGQAERQPARLLGAD